MKRMTKIIDGLLYDTQTATELCDVTSPGASQFQSDFEYEDTRLYRTKNGRFFTAGEGGAKSRYSVRLGSNGLGGGEGLEVVSEEEAKSLVERFGTTETYAEVFGPPAEA